MKVSAKELQARDHRAFEKEYDKWLGYATDYEWWDCLFADFKEDCDKFGYHVDEIYFSGFGYQSDYCASDGTVRVAEFLEADESLISEPKYFVMSQCIHNGLLEPEAEVTMFGNHRHTTQVQYAAHRWGVTG